ncbi:MAG: ATP-binding protein [Cytophagales bacterium]|nr:ATP-binding protein [Cytophagales bacterium]MDW8384181.1 ATP-binding protein [Flammeovirgaceae bacterium]
MFEKKEPIVLEKRIQNFPLELICHQFSIFRRWSVRRRLMLFFTSLILLLTLLQYLCIYWVNQYYNEQDFILRLREKAILETQLFLEDSIQAHQNHIIQKRYQSFTYDETICIFNTEGSVYYSGTNTCTALSKKVIEKIKQYKEVVQKSNNGKVSLWILYNNGASDYITLISAYNRYAEEQDAFFRKVLILGFIISVFLVIAIGFVLTHIALRPFEHIVEQMNAISVTNLNLRLAEYHEEDEIGRLAKSFNKFLDRLEEAFNMQKAFVNNVSHELRTPLTKIIGEADIALSRERTPEEYRRVIQAQLKEAEKLQKITNHLLLLAQIGSHRQSFLDEEIRVDFLIQQAIEDVRREQPQADVLFEFTPPSDGTSITILTNYNLFNIMLKNIIENACKFSDFQQVSVQLFSQDNKVTIAIKDKGIGIPESEIAHIFEPFYRGKNVEKRKGSGIGMYLVKNIVQLHEGEIKIESVENKGTTVYLSFATIYSRPKLE